MSTLVFNFQKTPLGRTLGVAKYALRLAAALAPRYDITFLLREDDPVEPLASAGVGDNAVLYRVKANDNAVHLAVEDGLEIRAHHFQPSLTSLPSVVIVHDFHAFHVPWKYPDPQSMQRLLIDCADRADAVLTEFPYTYYNFTRYTGLSSSKLFWVGSPLLLEGAGNGRSASVERVRATSGKKILYPAQLQQHKNHIALVQALAIVAQRVDVSLLLTGTEFDTDYGKAIDREVQLAGLGNRVVHLGNVSDDELLTIYDLVDATIIPSLAEGGAYVPLESLSRGTPVATSDIESVRLHLRSAGVEDDVIYFDPTQPSQIGEAVAAAVSRSDNLRDRRPPVTLFLPTWQQAAENCGKVIDWLLGHRSRPFVQVDSAFRLVGLSDD